MNATPGKAALSALCERLRRTTRAGLPLDLLYRPSSCNAAGAHRPDAGAELHTFCPERPAEHPIGRTVYACADSACAYPPCVGKHSYIRSSRAITRFAALPPSPMLHVSYTTPAELRSAIGLAEIQRITTATRGLAEIIIRVAGRLVPHVVADGTPGDVNILPADDLAIYSVFHPCGTVDGPSVYKPHWNLFISAQVRRGDRYVPIDPASIPRDDEGHITDYRDYWRAILINVLCLDAPPVVCGPHLSVTPAGERERDAVLILEFRSFPGWYSLDLSECRELDDEPRLRALARMQPSGLLAGSCRSRAVRRDAAARAYAASPAGLAEAQHIQAVADAAAAEADARAAEAQGPADAFAAAAADYAGQALDAAAAGDAVAEAVADLASDILADAAAVAALDAVLPGMAAATARAAATYGRGAIAPAPRSRRDPHRCPGARDPETGERIPCGCARVHADQLSPEQAEALLALHERTEQRRADLLRDVIDARDRGDRLGIRVARAAARRLRPVLTPHEAELLAQRRQGYGYLRPTDPARPTLDRLIDASRHRRALSGVLHAVSCAVTADRYAEIPRLTIATHAEIERLAGAAFGRGHADVRDALAYVEEILVDEDPDGEALEHLRAALKAVHARHHSGRNPAADDEGISAAHLDDIPAVSAPRSPVPPLSAASEVEH